MKTPKAVQDHALIRLRKAFKGKAHVYRSHGSLVIDVLEACVEARR